MSPETTLKLTGEKPEPDEPKGSSSSSKRGGDEKPGARTDRRHAADVRERLERVLERLVEWLEGRGDVELAGALKEDRRAIIGGIVSLTRGAAWVRPPLLAVLSVAEPALAFGRVLRILLGRWSRRRAERAAEEPARDHVQVTIDPQAWAEASVDELRIIEQTSNDPTMIDAARDELRRRGV